MYLPKHKKLMPTLKFGDSTIPEFRDKKSRQVSVS